jgi:hypothetical protein
VVASGQQIGARFQANDTPVRGHDYRYIVSSLTGGGWVVAWRSGAGLDVAVFNASGQRVSRIPGVGLDPLGRPLDDALYTEGYSIAPRANGGFLVAWGSYGVPNARIYLQEFNANGAQTVAPLVVVTHNSNDYDIWETGLTEYDGGVALSYVMSRGGSNRYEVATALFDPSLTVIGGNQTMADPGIIATSLTVRPLASGGFMNSWVQVQTLVAGAEQELHAQRFNDDGQARGNPFLVDVGRDGAAIRYSATGMADGGAVFLVQKPEQPDGVSVYGTRSTPLQ